MLYFDRIGVSEGIDVNKISALKECDFCHYWYFLNYSFKFKPNACNRCQDLLMMSMSFSDIATLNIKVSDHLINKIEATKLMQNADLTKKLERFKT